MANRYVADVLSGKVIACEYVKQACQRQKDDLTRSRAKGSKWQYRFDKEAAEHVCAFAEMMPHIKGKLAKDRELLRLEPWQAFILTTVFGWLHRKTGLRRFKTVYTEIPRKNAKSFISSVVGNYMTFMDGEEGAEVYAAATTREQAKLVFDVSLKMVNKLPLLRDQAGVDTTKYSIFQMSTNSSFKALSRDQNGNLDGLNIHCAIVDELHGHKDRTTWDVLVTATGARSQPIIWGITTAGFNRAGICYEQRTYITKILDRTTEDDSVFGIIYTIDKGDDWKDPKSWVKANPNWGVSVDPEHIEKEARKAIAMSSAQNNFLTKHLNVWVNADSAWMNMAKWDECCDLEMDIEDFRGKECIMAADLASKNDFACTSKVFRKNIDGKDHFYVFTRHYLNEEAAANNPNDQLAGWIQDGWVEVSQGSVTDFNLIEEDIKQDCREFQVKEVCFDPYQAAQMQQNLSAAGITPVEYTNNLKNMSEPTKEVEALILDGRLHHDGDPVLAWMISNVVAHVDARDTVYPKRDRTMPYNKIDGAISLIMAIGRYMQDKPQEPTFAMAFVPRRR